MVGASLTVVSVTEKRITGSKKRVTASKKRVWISPTAVCMMENIVATSETAVTVTQKRFSVAQTGVGEALPIVSFDGRAELANPTARIIRKVRGRTTVCF
jgi:hypothetical protein